MTKSTGVGRGGKREGAGRRYGARNKKARELIKQAAQAGQMLPLDYLLATMRDEDLPPQIRLSAATVAAPFCHPKLSVTRSLIDPTYLDDRALISEVHRLEAEVARMPESDRVAAVTAQFGRTIDDIAQLSPAKQQEFFRKLGEISAAGLEQLNAPDRPGAVLPHPSPNKAAIEHEPTNGSTHGPMNGAAPRPTWTDSAPNGSVNGHGSARPSEAELIEVNLWFDPDTGELTEQKPHRGHQ